MGIFDRVKDTPARQPDTGEQNGQDRPADEYAADEHDPRTRSNRARDGDARPDEAQDGTTRT